jgi:hypothetical protein
VISCGGPHGQEGEDVKSHRVAELVGTVAAGILLSLLLTPMAQAQVNPAPILPSRPYPPAPRLADGTPNLGPTEPNRGYWNLTAHQDYAKVLLHPAKIPYQPWAWELARQRREQLSKYDPEGYCLPPSGPRLMTTPFPMEILQVPAQKRILMIYEGGTHLWRVIYMDGRPHPEGDRLNPTWLGHSVGRWEGDTLVVDVVGFNEGSWIDLVGDPHTDLLHVVERYSRPDLYTLRYEATIDDPGAYTEPWTIGLDVVWDEKGEIQEYICQENNIWLQRLATKDKDQDRDTVVDKHEPR